MKAVWLYRIASVLFVLFAAGHTFGFLSFRPPTAEGMAVWDAMNRVHFTDGTATFSYGGFYIGFGLYVTMYMLFSAFLAWHLSRLARRAPEAIGALGWVFFVLQLASLTLSWIYFSGVPALFCAVAAVCLGWAVLALPKHAPN
jgi:hypothetical protein